MNHFNSSTADAVPSSLDVVIVGGCGHVGLPLGIALATRGLRVALLDVDHDAIAMVSRGQLPFAELGAEAPLNRAIDEDQLLATCDPRVVSNAEVVIIVIGTPIDEYLNADVEGVQLAVEGIAPYLHDGQLLVLRSTIYPGVTAMVESQLERIGLDIDVAFCPERIAGGKAMQELFELPQIVAARSRRGRDRASKLFSNLVDDLVHLEPEEGEIAKLFTNVWRYVKFATANQLYMMANDRGLDYERVRNAVTYMYPRAADLPPAGFAAGPCLLKDTLQLAAFNYNNFPLGHASVAINEGLPHYVVSRLEQQFDLSEKTVGILGMAFKAGTDDIRSSLSYKLKRLLRFRARRVLTHDPYVTVDPEIRPYDEVVSGSDVLIIATPHEEYRRLTTSKTVVDLWNVLERGTRV
jgi:UDP-N-acetyl-D-mannosaminuronic acid dehydrogenase